MKKIKIEMSDFCAWFAKRWKVWCLTFVQDLQKRQSLGAKQLKNCYHNEWNLCVIMQKLTMIDGLMSADICLEQVHNFLCLRWCRVCILLNNVWFLCYNRLRWIKVWKRDKIYEFVAKWLKNVSIFKIITILSQTPFWNLLWRC